MAMPRYLPIVFVAVGGVLALKVLSSLEVMPEALRTAVAFAAPATSTKAAGEVKKDGDPTAALSANPALAAADVAVPAAATVGPMACATSVEDLARQAGMSPNEIQILQSLGARRQELDRWEQQLEAREKLIQTAEAKLDSRIKQLEDLRGQVQGLLDQAKQQADADTMRMVKVYENMKPKDAAAIFTTMSDEVRLPIAAAMKERSLAAILAAMPPAAARELTEKLAGRMKSASGMQGQLDRVTAGAPRPQGAATTTPPPAATPAPGQAPAQPPAQAGATPAPQPPKG